MDDANILYSCCIPLRASPLGHDIGPSLLQSHPVHSLIVGYRRCAPALQELWVNMVHLDTEWMAHRQRVACVGSPGGHGHIPVGTDGEGAQHIYFGKE